MISHAAWVEGKRSEVRRNFETTCIRCGEEQVRDDVCGACNFEQSLKRFDSENGAVSNYSVKDELEWEGVVYVGDDEESALMKLKAADNIAFMAYNNHALVAGMRMDANQEAGKRGMFKGRK
jgi:hypothetical protein